MRAGRQTEKSCVQKKRAGEQSALVMFYPYLLCRRYLLTPAHVGIWSLYPNRSRGQQIALADAGIGHVFGSGESGIEHAIVTGDGVRADVRR